MQNAGKSLTVLMADDDEDDVLLTEKAMASAGSRSKLFHVSDGEELFDYLRHRGKYQSLAAPRPDIILLDLNMPRKNGRQVLREIKADEIFKRIPIVVMTTSADRGDITGTYALGASSYIVKPVTFSGLVETVRELEHYWSEIVQLPQD